MDLGAVKPSPWCYHHGDTSRGLTRASINSATQSLTICLQNYNLNKLIFKISSLRYFAIVMEDANIARIHWKSKDPWESYRNKSAGIFRVFIWGQALWWKEVAKFVLYDIFCGVIILKYKLLRTHKVLLYQTSSFKQLDHETIKIVLVSGMNNKGGNGFLGCHYLWWSFVAP